MKPQKSTYLLFKRPVTSDWAFWVLMVISAINAYSSYQTYYAGSSPTTPGMIAGAIDLVFLPLFGSYLLLLIVLIPRKLIIRRKENS